MQPRTDLLASMGRPLAIKAGVFLGVFRANVVRKFAGILEFLEKFLEFSHKKWSFTKQFLNFRTKTRGFCKKNP